MPLKKSIHYRNSIPITSRLHTIIFPLYFHYISIIFKYIHLNICIHLSFYILLLLLLYNKFIICVITYDYVHVYTCIIYICKYTYICMYAIAFYNALVFLHIYSIYQMVNILDASNI